jgi:membrane protein
VLRKLFVIIKNTAIGYTTDSSGQQAAAITYYVLFSMVPLGIFGLSVLGRFLGTEEVQEQVVDWIMDTLPFTPVEGRKQVEDFVSGLQNISTSLAIVGIIAALWGSLGMFSAVRRSLNNIWGMREERPFVQSKLVDLFQVGLVALVLLGSVVLTGFLRVARQISTNVGGPISGDSALWEVPTALIPLLVTFIAFCGLYKIVPAARPKWRSVIPGALLAALLFEILKQGFAIYVANFNNYDAVYGALGGVMLFLFSLYLSSCILLVGGELIETLERYHRGALAEELTPAPLPSSKAALRERAIVAVKGLFVRTPPPPAT